MVPISVPAPTGYCNNDLSDSHVGLFLPHVQGKPGQCPQRLSSKEHKLLPFCDAGNLNWWLLDTVEGEAKAGILLKMFLQGKTESGLYPSVLNFLARTLSQDPNLTRRKWNVPVCSGTGNGIDELIVLARVIMWHFIWSLTNDLVYLSFLSHQIDAWTTVMSYFFYQQCKIL